MLPILRCSTAIKRVIIIKNNARVRSTSEKETKVRKYNRETTGPSTFLIYYTEEQTSYVRKKRGERERMKESKSEKYHTFSIFHTGTIVFFVVSNQKVGLTRNLAAISNAQGFNVGAVGATLNWLGKIYTRGTSLFPVASSNMGPLSNGREKGGMEGEKE